MEKKNGFYVYSPQQKEETNNQNNKQQENNYIEAMLKSNKVPTAEEQYYAELQQQADLQKTLNGDTKDLPEVGILDKIDTSIGDLVLNRFVGGMLGSVEGLIDLVIDGAGTVGTLFGADDEWAKKARSYDLSNLGKNLIYYSSPFTRGNFWDLFTPENEYEEAQAKMAEHSWFNQEGAGQIVGNVVEGVGGLLPSIMVGNLAGGIATGLGASTKVVGIASQVASTASFGMGAMGQSTQQALNEGASYEDAKLYGLASGLMETGIEMLSGGVGGVGTGLAQKVFPKLTKNTVVKFVASTAGEGIEEMTSEMISPFLKRVTYDENAPTATTEQVLESGLVGALVGSVMQGGQMISTPKSQRIANDIQDLVEVQNQYYEKGQYDKVETISQEIKQKGEELVAELEKKGLIETKDNNVETKVSESVQNTITNQNELDNENTTQKVVTPPTEIENKKVDTSSTQTLKTDDKKKTYLRKINNADADFVKAYANLNAEKVFTKKETKDAVKDGDKILNKLIFEQLNTIKNDTKQNIRNSKFKEIAEEIVDYTQLTSKTEYSVEDRELAIELTKMDLEQFYNTRGKEGKYVKFEKYFKDKVKSLKKEVSDIKKLNKVLRKASYTAKQIRELKKKRYADRLGGAVVDSKLKAMSKLLGRISVRDFLSSKTRQHIAEYGRLFYNSKLANEKGYEVSESILKDIALFEKNLDKKGSLSLEEAEALERILADAKFKIKKSDQIKINGKKVEVPEVSKSVIETIKSTKFKSVLLSKYINSSVNPRVVFRSLDNFTDGYLTQLFRDIQKSETKYYEQYMKFYQPFNDFSNKNKKYVENLNKEKVTVNGKVFKRGEMLSIHMLSKRKQALPHLLESGVTLKDTLKNKKKTIKITEADIEAISNMLNEKDNELIGITDNFFNKVAKNEKIKADLALLGYTNILEGTDSYFPINVDPVSRFQTLGEPDSDMSSITSVFNYSFNKDIVPGARNEIVLTGINMVVQKHARQLAMYTSMTEAVQNLSSVWNRKVDVDGKTTTLKKELSEVWADGYKYIDNLIKDIEGTQIRDETEKIISKIRSNYSVFQLGANLKSIVTQFGAIPNAMLYLDATSITKGYTMKFDFKNMDKYCPYVAFRNFDNDFIKSELLYEQQMNKVQDFFMKGLSGVDRLILGQLWNGCQIQVKKDYDLEIGTEANMKRAGELLEKITRETQANSTSDRSSLSRNKNEFVRGFMQFMSSATQNLSVMVESTMEVNHLAREYKNNKNEETKILLQQAKKKAVRSYGSVITGLMFTSMVDKLWKKLRGQDDEEDEYGVLKNIGSNMASLFPFVREAYNKVVEGYDIEHYGLSAVNNLLSIGDYDLTTPKGIRSAIYAIGEIVGIPVRNLNNAFEVVLSVTDNKTTWDSLFYNTDLSDKKQEITTYLNRNRTDKASKVVDSIFTERGLINTQESIAKKYVTFAKSNIFTYPKALSANITIDGREYQLSDDEYSAIQLEYNKAHSSASKALNYKDFATLSDINQSRVMNKIYEAHYYQAVNSVIGVEDVSKLKLSIYNKVIPIYKLLTHAYKIQELSKNKSNKKEIAQKYINKLPMSRAQKELMMVYLGYSISKPTLIPTIRTYLTSKGIVGEERDYILSLCE